MPIIRWARGLPAILAAVAFSFGPAAAAPTVVASIAPVHSLVAAVMAGVGEPRLLVPGGSSPHSHALRPSDARAIEAAGLVIWVGPGLENFLERPIASLARAGEVLRLADIEGLQLLPLRDDHGHDHGYSHGHGHSRGHGHDAGIDMHIWLDPANAQRMAVRIGEALAGIDPANVETYRRNAAALGARLAALDQDIARRMSSLAGRRFIVFHDGYQYFEHRYGLAQAGVFTVNPEVSPGAERIRRLRARIADDDVACVFIEPQFSASIAEAVIEGTKARIGRLDPLGAGIPPGPELYPRLIENLAASFLDCFSTPGGDSR